MKSHVKTHRKDRVWYCVYCPYKSNERRRVISHVKAIRNGIREFHCSHCDLSFKTKRGVEEQLLRHKGIKNFQCTFCGFKKITERERELEIHVNTYTKEKMWYCERSPHKTTSKNEIGRHVRIVHQGVRNHHCPHCDKSFATTAGLKNHVMIHTGERPFTCDECGMKFRRKYSLRGHMKYHQPETKKKARESRTKTMEKSKIKSTSESKSTSKIKIEVII